MSLFRPAEFRFFDTVSRLIHGNPFLPQRIELEKQVLGGDYRTDPTMVWSMVADPSRRQANVELLDRKVVEAANRTRARLVGDERGSRQELDLYSDLVLHLLYYRNQGRWHEQLKNQSGPRRDKKNWLSFEKDYRYYLELEGLTFTELHGAAHAYAVLNQVCRAFYNIYDNIIGNSLASARLRAAIWQSIFTFDMRRYRRCLYDQMQDISTLITGPSGTGKDLVAAAIGHSRFIRFDPQKWQFEAEPEGSFLPLNLSAMSPSLIESELFGHAAGAFTGAVQERTGWLQHCQRFGSVFLDEIGDLDVSIQVKLLRVLQNRQFQRIGESGMHHFPGKIITATNRDLPAEIARGNFREDFYYRLCSDVVVTPTLRDQLAESPGDLSGLLGFLVKRILGDPDDDEQREATQLIQTWITSHLPDDYPWPGNVRELEQCARNVIVRNQYSPQPQRTGEQPVDDGPWTRMLGGFRNADLSLADLQSMYCTIAYWQTGNYEKAATRLGIDRRTVRARVDESLLDELRRSSPD